MNNKNIILIIVLAVVFISLIIVINSSYTINDISQKPTINIIKLNNNTSELKENNYIIIEKIINNTNYIEILKATNNTNNITNSKTVCNIVSTAIDEGNIPNKNPITISINLTGNIPKNAIFKCVVVYSSGYFYDNNSVSNNYNYFNGYFTLYLFGQNEIGFTCLINNPAYQVGNLSSPILGLYDSPAVLNLTFTNEYYNISKNGGIEPITNGSLSFSPTSIQYNSSDTIYQYNYSEHSYYTYYNINYYFSYSTISTQIYSVVFEYNSKFDLSINGITYYNQTDLQISLPEGIYSYNYTINGTEYSNILTVNNGNVLIHLNTNLVNNNLSFYLFIGIFAIIIIFVMRYTKSALLSLSSIGFLLVYIGFYEKIKYFNISLISTIAFIISALFVYEYIFKTNITGERE